MNKKFILAMLFAIGLLISICPSVTTAYIIEDIGTFDYQGTMITFIYAPVAVDLHYVSSDLFEGAVTVERLHFYNATNLTQFRFTSEEVPIDWTFNASKKVFIYQDINSSKLYQIKIDYTDIDVPPNPWRKLYADILELYNLTKGRLENSTGGTEHFSSLYNDTSSALDGMSYNLSCLEGDYTSLGEEKKRMQAELNSGPIINAIVVFGTFLVMMVFFYFYLRNRPPQSVITEDVTKMKMDAGKKLDNLAKEDKDVFKETKETEITDEKKEEKITDETIMNMGKKTEIALPSDSKKTEVETTIKNIDKIFEDIDKKLDTIGKDIPIQSQITNEKIEKKTEEITKAITKSEGNIISHITNLGKVTK